MGKKERREERLLDAVIRLIPPLIKGMVQSDATELRVELKKPKVYLCVRRSVPTGEVRPAVHDASNPPIAVEQDLYEDKKYYPVTSPLTGTYYEKPFPQSPDPFVRVGQFVEEGQTLCIVEAAKIMNQIVSERAGKVVAMIAQNGKLVNEGHRLMVIDTSQTPPAPPSPYA